jgi:hypothetical protein
MSIGADEWARERAGFGQDGAHGGRGGGRPGNLNVKPADLARTLATRHAEVDLPVADR